MGLARNVEGKVAQDVRRIHAAFEGLVQPRWLLIESDSSDRTLDDLAALQREIPGFTFQSLGQLAPRLPQRTARIAHCRNAYLEALETRADLADVQWVVMADLDGMNTMLTKDALASCWERDDWSMCAANQAGPYYDIWALRHPHWAPCDYKHSYAFLVDQGVRREAALQATLLSRMITLHPDSAWIEVESAFGGLAIYRREALHGLRYQGLDEQGREVCEHVGLHAAMRARGARLFINPRLINTDSTEHVAVLGLPLRLYRLVHDSGRWLRDTVVRRHRSVRTVRQRHQ